MAFNANVVSVLTLGRLREGLIRVRDSWAYIVQLALAAGVSFFLGKEILDHPLPFFAPMAAVIVLSSAGERVRKSLELVLGVSVGVGVGDIIMLWLGTGVWQIGLGVALAVTLAMIMDRGVLAANQAAFAAVLICTILPPETSGGLERMTDAFIGGVVALLFMAVFPQSPIRNGRREVAKVLGITSSILNETADALQSADKDAIEGILSRARGTQGTINSMIATAKVSKEVVLSNPFTLEQRRGLHSLLRILDPVDNAMRNTRVLARRCLVLWGAEEEVSETQLDVLRKLSQQTAQLSETIMYTKDFTMAPTIPKITNELTKLAGEMTAIEPQGLNTTMIYGQTRSLTVDLLMVCGLSRESAVEILNSDKV